MDLGFNRETEKTKNLDLSPPFLYLCLGKRGIVEWIY